MVEQDYYELLGVQRGADDAAIKAQQELGEEPTWPIPYGYAVKRRAK